MAKRRLSKNQARRIKQKQHASVTKANHQADRHADIHNPEQAEAYVFNDRALGPEQRGRIIAHFGTQVEVENHESNDDTPSENIRCHLRANLEPVITGDNIVWRRCGEYGVVVSCEARRTLLSRPDPYGKLKPVAANIDQLIIVIAPYPEFFTNLIDRYLVVAEINGIIPLILINKSDLINQENLTQFEALKKLYIGLGYSVIDVSVKSHKGLDTLEAELKNRTSIFVGQSGVGKSSIIQGLLPHEEIEVGDLSEAKTKGRHTTTHSELFRFSHGGECIDSPGIREFGLWNLDNSELIKGFPEIENHAAQCKFRDCQHESEPHCAVQNAIAQNKIAKSRFENYQRILSGLDDVEVRQPND